MKKIKKGDLFLILLIAVIAVPFLWTYCSGANSTGSLMAVVVRDGKLVKEIDLNNVQEPQYIPFTDGMKVTILAEKGRISFLDSDCPVVKIYRYFPNFDPAAGMNQMSVKPDNPRIIYSVYENSKLLGVGAAKFGEKVEIDTNINVTFAGVQPYTVLKVKSDPGLPLGLAGGLMFMIGVSLALLATPEKRKQNRLSEDYSEGNKSEEED